MLHSPTVQERVKTVQDGLWMQLLLACSSELHLQRKEKAVWVALDAVVPFLRGEAYAPGDADRFRIAINAFADAFIACWGEEQVTHYIHLLYAHGPWMIQEHGSLSVWNCQGMEKSHWRARGNWQKHTQHDGGRRKEGEENKIQRSSLYQLMEYDYRLLLHRRREQAVNQAHEAVMQEEMVRRHHYQTVWKQWYASATEDARAKCKETAGVARKARDAMRAAKREFFNELCQEMAVLKGVVDNAEAAWDDADMGEGEGEGE